MKDGDHAYLLDSLDGENETGVADTDSLSGRESTEPGLILFEEVGSLDEDFRGEKNLTGWAGFLCGEVGNADLQLFTFGDMLKIFRP